MIKKLRLLLLTVLFTVCGTAFADGWSEDFSGLSLVNDNGDPVGTYQFGTGLSNGWKVVGGTIYRGEGSTNYGYISTGGHTSNNGYLEASYGASNDASVWVSAAMPGDELTFWIKCTSSKSSITGYYKIYEANADGSITATVLGEGSLKGGSAWTQKTVEGVNGKYIAINLIRMQIDDMECNTAVVEQKADLNILQKNILSPVALDETSNQVWIQYENKGNAAATNAVATLYVNNVVNATKEIGTIDVNGNGYAYLTYDKTTISAGTYPVYISITADNDDTESTSTKQSETVDVTFEVPVVEVKDLAISQVSCNDIDLAEQSHFVTVVVVNNGNVDIENAPVSIKATIGGEEKVIGTDVISAKAGTEGNTGSVNVSINTEGMTVGSLTMTISVEVEGDATPDDNTMPTEVNVVDNTDGIAAVNAEMKKKGAQVYTIGGTKVGKVNEGGIYIVNGRKVVVK